MVRHLGSARSAWPRELIAAIAAVICFVVPAIYCPAHAQETYPNRSVHLIVPYGPGGVADVSMRILADKLSDQFKQQFVVENRPGAGGIIAAKGALAARADGYTILMTGNNNAISTALFKSLPYNVLTDFDSVSTVSFFDLLIITKSNQRLRSLQDVLSRARENSDGLKIATTNPGSTQHLAAVLFSIRSSGNVTIIPFKTSSDMAAALLREDVDIAFEFFSATVGLITAGQVVALASTGKTRTSFLPHVPTVQEIALDNYEVTSWNGISVPKGTPAAVVQRLSAATNQVLLTSDVQEQAKLLGMEMRGSTPAVMAELMRSDIAKWTGLVEKAGIPKHE